MWRSDVMESGGGGRGNSYPGTIMSGNSAPTAAPDSPHAGSDPSSRSSTLPTSSQAVTDGLDSSQVQGRDPNQHSKSKGESGTQATHDEDHHACAGRQGRGHTGAPPSALRYDVLGRVAHLVNT